MNYHSSFDGFAESDFIGEQNSGRIALTDLLGNVQLVGDQIHPSTDKTAVRGLIPLEAVFAAPAAEVERVRVGYRLPQQPTQP